MKLRIKRFAATAAALLLALCVLAQPTATVQWSDSTAAVGDSVYEITFTGRILDGWHTYDLHSGFSSTVIAFEPSEGVELVGDSFEKVAAERRFDEIFGEEIGEYEGEIVLGQRVRLTAAEGVLRGNINWRSCQGDNCNMPEDWPFEIRLPAGSAGQDTAGDALHQSPLGDAADPAGKGLLGLILVAIGWGLLALLTPCVFPMIPMTVSFFLKGSESASAGRFKASMYGLFIVLLYTVPIAAIILLTRLLGGDAVTADIFNWLATHWLPNLIFFIVFMVFAASFFGAFEITLPGWMVNKSDRNADRGGLLGVFFMALTLVLVSFSCTGPIVGSAIIGATAGDFWAPILTMLVFSITFALPFTLFAMFPSLLKNLPKSGGWLNSVKVVLGFIELAFALKFLSNADMVLDWHLLEREVFIALWVVIFAMMGFYLLGKIRLPHDSPLESISVTRLFLALITLSFALYLVPGIWGAPVKIISAFAPPTTYSEAASAGGSKETLEILQIEPMSVRREPIGLPYRETGPQGIPVFTDLEQATTFAKAMNRPILLDFTGKACVNCRKMEADVWSDARVKNLLSNEFVVVELYVDFREKLPESEQYTTPEGKSIRTVGQKWTDYQIRRFGSNSQPYYVITDPDDRVIAPTRAYDTDVEAYLAWLNEALETFRAQK